jgi:hypothetical protein
MDTKPSKSRLQHQEQTSEQQMTSQKQAVREFASVEDLLRYDASQVTPPSGIAERLKASLETDPPPKRGWWRRLFESKETL